MAWNRYDLWDPWLTKNVRPEKLCRTLRYAVVRKMDNVVVYVGVGKGICDYYILQHLNAKNYVVREFYGYQENGIVGKGK